MVFRTGHVDLGIELTDIGDQFRHPVHFLDGDLPGLGAKTEVEPSEAFEDRQFFEFPHPEQDHLGRLVEIQQSLLVIANEHPNTAAEEKIEPAHHHKGAGQKVIDTARKIPSAEQKNKCPGTEQGRQNAQGNLEKVGLDVGSVNDHAVFPEGVD